MSVRIYGVATYRRSGQAFERARLDQFASRSDALAEGEDRSRGKPSVVVFKVTGDPELGIWQEPQVLAAYGDCPKVLT